MSASWIAGFGYSIVRLLEHRKALQVRIILRLVRLLLLLLGWLELGCCGAKLPGVSTLGMLVKCVHLPDSACVRLCEIILFWSDMVSPMRSVVVASCTGVVLAGRAGAGATAATTATALRQQEGQIVTHIQQPAAAAVQFLTMHMAAASHRHLQCPQGGHPLAGQHHRLPGLVSIIM